MRIYYIDYKEPLKQFISRCELKLQYKTIKFDIMDYFPYLKQGIIHEYYWTLTRLFELYFHFNENTSNKKGLFEQCFEKNHEMISELIFNNCRNVKKYETNELMEEIQYERNLIIYITNLLKNTVDGPSKSDPVTRNPIYYINNWNNFDLDKKFVELLCKNNDFNFIYNCYNGHINLKTKKPQPCPFVCYSAIVNYEFRSWRPQVKDCIKFLIEDYCIIKLWHIKHALPNILEKADMLNEILNIIESYIQEIIYNSI